MNVCHCFVSVHIFTSRNTFNSTAGRADTDSSEFRAEIVVNVPDVGKAFSVGQILSGFFNRY